MELTDKRFWIVWGVLFVIMVGCCISVGCVVFRFLCIAQRAKRLVIPGIERQEIQPVAHCRILAPQSGGNIFPSS